MNIQHTSSSTLHCIQKESFWKILRRSDSLVARVHYGLLTNRQFESGRGPCGHWSQEKCDPHCEFSSRNSKKQHGPTLFNALHGSPMPPPRGYSMYSMYSMYSLASARLFQAIWRKKSVKRSPDVTAGTVKMKVFIWFSFGSFAKSLENHSIFHF